MCFLIFQSKQQIGYEENGYPKVTIRIEYLKKDTLFWNNVAAKTEVQPLESHFNIMEANECFISKNIAPCKKYQQ